jgi:cytochrome c556
MMMRIVLAATTVVFAMTAALAQDPIAARKALMKATGNQAAQGAKLVRGEEPFDVAKAQAIFMQYEKTASDSKGLFPDNTRTGGDTAALPAVWENKADFEAKLAKLGTDARAASAKVKDLDSFKAAFSEVQKNCGGCHENYRAKRS